MFKRRTLFILGAGASADLNLPTGEKLAERISTMLRLERPLNKFNADVAEAMTLDRPSRPHIFEAAKFIAENIYMSQSIDSFIDSHREDADVERCGKLAIVSSILQAEADTCLYSDNRIVPWKAAELSGLATTWYRQFFHILTSGVALNEVRNIMSQLSFIIFNYDRCFETFLIESLCRFYRITIDQAVEIVSSADIVHPYGSIGPLWSEDGSKVVRFGENRGGAALLRSCTENIRTFTEQLEDKTEMQHIHGVIEAAERYVFLGFAFHEQNMTLLTKTPRSMSLQSGKSAWATASGLSPAACTVVSGDIQRMVNAHQLRALELRSELKCREFMNEYMQVLTR